MKHVILPFIISLFIAFTPNIYANDTGNFWQTDLKIIGENLGGSFEESVTIGVEENAKTIEAPPMPPPKYSVKMDLTDLNGPLMKKDIRNETGYQEWIIVINPSGNIMPPIPRTSSLSWNPDKLGNGSYVLKKGYDGKGIVLLEDMKVVSSYDITGYGNEYFTICYTPY